MSGHVGDNGPGKWFSTGDPTGLYHLVVGEGQNAFIANGTSKVIWHALVYVCGADASWILQGLGGTSLLNANVFMRADPKTLACRFWPKEIRDETLDRCMNPSRKLKKTSTNHSQIMIAPSLFSNQLPTPRNTLYYQNLRSWRNRRGSSG